jgi:hypothetical protein
MKIACIFAILAAALAAQTPPQPTQQRDLKYESGAPTATETVPTAVAIPRSYALVIGVANYKNLSAKDQLQFSERDAEAIYSILISPKAAISTPRTCTS